jgi:hypothetical protein
MGGEARGRQRARADNSSNGKREPGQG